MTDCEVLPPPRCSVALAFECDSADAALLSRLCNFAGESGTRLQLFVPEAHAAWVCDLPGGHDGDLLSPVLVPPLDADLAAVEESLVRALDAFANAFGHPPIGLRAQAMARNGIQKQADIQKMLLRLGLQFVSSDYSTRHRAHAHDKAADDNAVRNMKHLQARRYPSGPWEIPATGYSDRDFLDELGGSLDDWIAHMKACLEFAYNLGNLVYAPRLTLSVQARHDPDLRALRALFEYAAGLPEPVAFLTYRDIHRLATEAVTP